MCLFDPDGIQGLVVDAKRHRLPLEVERGVGAGEFDPGGARVEDAFDELGVVPAHDDVLLPWLTAYTLYLCEDTIAI